MNRNHFLGKQIQPFLETVKKVHFPSKSSWKADFEDFFHAKNAINLLLILLHIFSYRFYQPQEKEPRQVHLWIRERLEIEGFESFATSDHHVNFNDRKVKKKNVSKSEN